MALRTSTSAAKTRPARKAGTTAGDALNLLKADHRKVERLFNAFKKLTKTRANRGTRRQKDEIVRQLCLALTVHAEIEEEIFYPAARRAIKDSELMDEALVEHGTVKAVVEQLASMEPGDELYDANVIVLAEYVQHHVREEEQTMFPLVQKTRLDLASLGERLKERKEELTGELSSRFEASV